MKTYLRRQIEKASSPIQAGNITREYLQARILEQLQFQGGMIHLAFQGGTALRFLFELPRFSEDLDFTLERQSGDFNFEKVLEKIQREFEKETYQVSLKINAKKIVYAAFIRFPGLLFELGLSQNRNQVLAVKLEIDTRPPEGAVLATTIVRRYVTLQLQHHDRASLLAGKIHALLQRNYVKGRDIYDLFWYLSNRKWPEPNLVLLNNALKQTEWQGDKLAADTWRGVIREKVSKLPWKNVFDDVAPFLEKEAEIRILTRENLLRLLE